VENNIMCKEETDAKRLFPTLADRAVCINLIERDDRMKEAQEQFQKVGLLDSVVFHRVERHPRGGRYGCYNSHREVMQQALKDNLKTLLIFEDDVQFQDGWEEVVRDAKKFLDSGTEFDAFFLGSLILFVDERHTSTVWRVKCSCAHAYVVSKEGMEAFLANSDKFEAGILLHPQDVTQMSVWQRMYAHTSTHAITQAPFLGTDNHWFPDIPPKYGPWLQIQVLSKFQTFVFPLVRKKWYHESWFGRRFVIGVEKGVIDDGRIRLRSLLLIEYLLTIIFILCTYPPYGYVDFFLEFVIPVTLNRILKAKGKVDWKGKAD
jgi:GR25 family glycosyltransferase involved in LPS biosynthesis